MDSLSFWDIFCPVLGALMLTTLFFEAINFALAYWQSKRQMAKYEEFQEKMEKGEVTPEMLGYMVANSGGMPVGFEGPPTASGSEARPSGQYL